MSKPFQGYVEVAAVADQGMISMRADLADKAVAKAVKDALGVAMPGQIGITGDAVKIGWMGPDEALILCPGSDVATHLAALEKALSKTHHLLADVSDARAVFTLKGAAVREVLAKLSPVDCDAASLTTGQLRRTIMAQVAAAFWLDTDDAATVICFRSYAPYMRELLQTAAAPGAEVFA